jgi:hypothetical protein
MPVTHWLGTLFRSVQNGKFYVCNGDQEGRANETHGPIHLLSTLATDGIEKVSG